MRLNLLLPTVEPEKFEKPKKCPTEGCNGTDFYQQAKVKKSIVDTKYKEVSAWRYKCLKCGHSFRVYPQGVDGGQSSQRLRGMAVMFYMMGLSYGATALVLHSLGVGMGKTSVYRVVQEVVEKVPGMKRKEIAMGYQTKAVGVDVTSVKCKGKWLTIAIAVDATNGFVLSIDELSGQETADLKEWLTPILDAVGAEIVVSDDADAFKTVSNDTGCQQQVCKSHVQRNTDALVDTLITAIQERPDNSLSGIGITDEQAISDITQLQAIIHSRRVEDIDKLESLYLRYAKAVPPKKGAKHSIAYRMRNLFLDRWNLWTRLTFYRTWKHKDGNRILDGTNNGCERAIGWWIKERYRTIRGYKKARNAIGMSRLIAHAGNQLSYGLHLSSLLG